MIVTLLQYVYEGQKDTDCLGLKLPGYDGLPRNSESILSLVPLLLELPGRLPLAHESCRSFDLDVGHRALYDSDRNCSPTSLCPRGTHVVRSSARPVAVTIAV
jgi:hypothetical protein